MTSWTTPKGERRRQALVEAAAMLLVEGGFDAVRHRAVADRAGLPLASTTYYFESLDQLITAAVEHHGHVELAAGRTRLTELGTTHRSADSLVELVLDLLLGPQSDHDAESVLLRYERLVATGRRPYLRPLMRTLGDELRGLIEEIFTRSGTAADDRQVEQLIFLVDGAVVNALIEVNPDPRGAARRVLHETLSGGLLPRPATRAGRAPDHANHPGQ